MVRFESDLSPEILLNKWDEHTSIARFAGSDDTMDLIFMSKRKGNKVKLVRKARFAYEPFSSVFRGKIVKTEKGSEIVGFFTKSFADYAIIAAVMALLFYIRSFIEARGESLNTINALLVAAIVGSVLLLINYRPTKRKYADFIYRITGKEMSLFLSKKENSDNKN